MSEALKGLGLVMGVMLVIAGLAFSGADIPPKEFIKKEMREAMEQGRFPGPEDERPEGPSPEEVEEIKKHPEAMEIINRISDRFGGSADTLIEIKDGDEVLMRILFTINPDVLFKITAAPKKMPELDATITVNFDFMYFLLLTEEKEIRGGHIEYPPWEKRPAKEMLKGAVDQMKMLSKVTAGLTSGDIKIEPVSAIPKLLATAIDFSRLMQMGEWGKRKEGRKRSRGEKKDLQMPSQYDMIFNR